MVNKEQELNECTHAISLEVNTTELQSLYFSAKEKTEVESMRNLHEQLKLISDRLEEELPEEIHHARLLAMSIPELARSEAASGRRTATVMRLSEEDFLKLPEYGEELGPHCLVPNRAANFLYQLCLQKDLDPQIRVWHEEDGFRSGFELTINW